MRSCRPNVAVASAVCVMSLVASARADDPSPETPKPPGDQAAASSSGVEWKALAQAGLILTTGNSRTTTMSAGAAASRKAGPNRFAIEGSGAFARSSVFLAIDANGNGAIDDGEIERLESTTTKAWQIKARYDRFLTRRNAVYLAALASADEPAGKEFVGGGQVGYSRLLLAGPVHQVAAETGYDYTYENYVDTDDGVSIHSARGFLGYEGKLSSDTGLSGAAEILVNINELDSPAGQIDSLEDTRFNGKVAITTEMFGGAAFRFSFTARYDHAPAPRPPFPTIPYAAGFQPLADELDTLTEVSLIVNFL